MISLAVAATGFLVFGYWANQLLVAVLPKLLYLVILFPGVVLHELSHFITAILTGTPVDEIKLFSSTGGHVIHEKPRIPVFGQLAISFAPLAIGVIAIYFLLEQLPLSDGINIAIPRTSIILILPTITGGLHLIYLLWIYLILSISLTLLPSKQDILASIAGIIVSIVILWIVITNSWLNIPPEIIGLIWYINISLALIVLIFSPVKMALKK